MKKIVYLISLVTLSVAVKAQTDTSLNKTAVAVCDCLTKNKVDEKSSPEEMQKVFLNCIFTSAPDFLTKIMSSGEDYQKAGEELGNAACHANGEKMVAPRFQRSQPAWQ